MANTTLSSNSFKKMLTRNVALPLLLSTALCGVFIGLILYMLSVNRWLDHSDQVIAKTNEIFKMTIDSETGLRGYLLTGDENFLEPYDRAETQLAPAFQELRLLVSDNAIETQRIDQISHLIAQWREYALDQMNLRRSPQYNPKKKVELAKSQMDGIRGVFHQLLEMEDSLRVERTENVQTTTRWLLAVILLFSAISGTILAIFGRKQLLQLSTEYESALQIQNKQNESLQEQARLLELQKDSLDRQNLYLKDAQESVKKKADELEAANRYKSEFLANMSHELRTPLNSTLILAKLLKENASGNLTAEQIEFASTIYGAGNDLLDLINDILDLSKVEAGKLEIRSEIVPLMKLVKNIENTFKPIAREKGLDFQFKISEKTPHVIETDRQRLEQILKNLLSNAFKFTKAGSITVTIQAEHQSRIGFTVTDTGPGIAPTQLQVIFEAFRQGDGTISRNHGGTGLGLTISKNLAHLLGGTISLKSELGHGSSFTLSLPEKYTVLPLNLDSKDTNSSTIKAEKPEHFEDQRQSETKPKNEPEHFESLVTALPPFKDDRDFLNGTEHRRILVVEDEPAFAKILFELSHEMDFKCVVATNTTDGFLLASKFLPHAIILDMKLPDGSGLSLLNRLKDNAQTRHIPVHGISVADYSHEALRLGAVGYVMKPADRDQLKETFRRLEEKISQQIRRVLVVEDDHVQRESIKRLIEGKGIEIVSVGLAGEALKHLSKTTFDCVIIDLALPDMSGFDLLERMAHDEKISFPPVIVYTGKSLTKAEEDTLRRYSKTIIIKGARSPERLLDEVSLFLHQVESQLTPEHRQMLRTSRSRESTFEGRRVLLVDDDVRNIFALRSTLQQKGAQIVVARNGKESIEQLDAHPDIDLVLMDIMMPVMDGYQAITAIRKNPRLGKVPIIAVTAKAMRDDYEKCLAAGASDYLAKPIDVDKLISLMRVWLPEPIGKA